jgi:hypothetical protein
MVSSLPRMAWKVKLAVAVAALPARSTALKETLLAPRVAMMGWVVNLIMQYGEEWLWERLF